MMTSPDSAFRIYHQTSDISHTLVGNKIVDHWDVVGALPAGAARTTFSFSTGFNGLGKNNCKTGRETFMTFELLPLILCCI